MASHSTTTEQGARMIERSRQVSRSTKVAKPSKPVFGTSSQFKGIGRGAKGDPRR